MSLNTSAVGRATGGNGDGGCKCADETQNNDGFDFRRLAVLHQRRLLRQTPIRGRRLSTRQRTIAEQPCAQTCFRGNGADQDAQHQTDDDLRDKSDTVGLRLAVDYHFAMICPLLYVLRNVAFKKKISIIAQAYISNRLLWRKMLDFLENWAVCAIFFGLEGVNVWFLWRRDRGIRLSDDPLSRRVLNPIETNGRI